MKMEYYQRLFANAAADYMVNIEKLKGIKNLSGLHNATYCAHKTWYFLLDKVLAIFEN